MTKISTMVKNIKFPDTVILMLFLWHQLLFSVHECFYKLNKMPIYRYGTVTILVNISLCVTKSNVSINSKTFF